MSKDIITQNQIRLLSLLYKLVGRFYPKEFANCRYSLLYGYMGNVRSRLHSQYGYIPFNKVLQQVTVIAGNLDYFTSCIEFESLNHCLAISLRMMQPRV